MLNPAIRWQPFITELRKELETAQRKHHTLGLILVEIRQFPSLNLLHGFNRVEALVRKVQGRLTDALPKGAPASRLGPDRLAIILPDVTLPELLAVAARKLAARLAEPYRVEGEELLINPCIGIAHSPDHGESAEALMAEADHALASARDMAMPYAIAGKAAEDWLRALHLEQELENALAKDDLLLYYQPQIDLRSGQPCGAEALMRWAHGADNMVTPETFIPVAETTGKIVGLTEWALNTAIRQVIDLDYAATELSISVNVSASSLYDPDLVMTVESGLAIWGLAPGRLTIEITESALMRNPTLCFEHLSRLRALGVRVAIDDFGTGFSSLAYFKTVPADEVKIDQSFIKHMAGDAEDARIVQLIIDLSHTFGLKVVAEGVENGEALARLRELGCDIAQGYHLARPLDYRNYKRWLAEFNPV